VVGEGKRRRERGREIDDRGKSGEWERKGCPRGDFEKKAYGGLQEGAVVVVVEDSFRRDVFHVLGACSRADKENDLKNLRAPAKVPWGGRGGGERG